MHRIDEIVRVLQNTSHEPKCESANKYHIYGCDFDGEIVGEEINVFPGNLKCTCEPEARECSCHWRTKRQAKAIIEWMDKQLKKESI